MPFLGSAKYTRIDMMNVCIGLMPETVNYRDGSSAVEVNFREDFDEGISLIYSSFVT
jgi:hypothetical protein